MSSLPSQRAWLRGLTALALSCTPAAAQELDDPALQPAPPTADSGAPSHNEEGTLDPFVVVATRSELAPAEVPYVTALLSETDLLEAQARTLPEALRWTPGVMVQKTAHGQGSPFIRGFTGFRNLLLIDGIRLNNSVFRDGPNQYWNTVDSYGLSRIELVKGPSSVLYGSDAIGGTLLAVTKSPLPPLGADAEGGFAGGYGLYRYSSGENSHVGRVEAWAGDAGRLGVLVGYTAKDYGDIEAAGLGRLHKTGYPEEDFDLKAQYLLSPEWALTLAHQSVDQDNVWRTHSTRFGESWEGTSVGSDLRRVLDQTRRLTYVQLAGDEMDGAVQRATFSLSYHVQEETEHRVRSNGRRQVQGADVDTVGLWAQLESETVAGTLSYGFDYYHDEVDSFSRRYLANGDLDRRDVQGPVGDNSDYDLFGIYLQDRVDLDPVEILAGVRYTYAETSIGRMLDPASGDTLSLSESWDDWVGNLRFLWRALPDDQLNLYAGVSQGFRSPNLSDLSRLDSARSGELETPSPGLDPEQFTNWEVGFHSAGDTWALHGAYFYNDIRDMIVRSPTGDVIDGEREVIKKNAGDGYIQGIELEGSWSPHPQWTLFGAFTWQDGEVDAYPTSDPREVREPASRLMPTTAVLGVRWDSPERRFWAELLATFADEQDDLSSSDKADTQRIPPGGTPSYAVWTLRGGWRPDDRWELSAALDNFTDQEYRVHGSGQNEPGINCIVSASARF